MIHSPLEAAAQSSDVRFGADQCTGQLSNILRQAFDYHADKLSTASASITLLFLCCAWPDFLEGYRPEPDSLSARLQRIFKRQRRAGTPIACT